MCLVLEVEANNGLSERLLIMAIIHGLKHVGLKDCAGPCCRDVDLVGLLEREKVQSSKEKVRHIEAEAAVQVHGGAVSENYYSGGPKGLRSK